MSVVEGKKTREMSKTPEVFFALAKDRIDRLDARLLLQEICGLAHTQLIAEPKTPLGQEQWQVLLTLLERRAAGEPLAYLIGHTEFRGRRFMVTSDVLIPRPETETLVELTLEKLDTIVLLSPQSRKRCVDLGTGSGIIAISLKMECPEIEMHAVDLSPQALAVAEDNARRLGADITFHHGSWFAPLSGQCFDLIVANPPYVAAGDPHLQWNGLPHEPQMALTDQADGLDCLRAIIADAQQYLQPNGWLLLEHGYDQGEASRRLLSAAGFSAIFTKVDLAGIDRISGGQKA